RRGLDDLRSLARGSRYRVAEFVQAARMPGRVRRPLGTCWISLLRSFLRASDGKMARILAEVISSNQPRIASGRERVRLGPIENALSLCLLRFKQGRGSLRSRAVGWAPQARLFAPIQTR